METEPTQTRKCDYNFVNRRMRFAFTIVGQAKVANFVCSHFRVSRSSQIMTKFMSSVFCLSYTLLFFCLVPPANGQSPSVVFEDDFESGLVRWEVLDPETWRIADREGNHTLEITARESAYAPPVRSPGHVALIKDLELDNFDITFKVRSTKDTGNHRDCCVFFAYNDDQHFYYAHLGAVPDPHSGQIMVVDEAPRLAMTENERLTPWDDQWHTVRLTRNADSGSIQVFFDDMTKPHMEVTDKRFTTGRVGIGSFDDQNEFDDVVVRKW
jgi:hypothetical protein